MYDHISSSSEVCIVEKHKPQKVVRRKVVKLLKKKQNQQPKPQKPMIKLSFIE